MQKVRCFWLWFGAWVISIILYRYYPADPTWWYYSSVAGVYHHPLGWWGATSAALLYMSLGYAAWCIPISMWCIGILVNYSPQYTSCRLPVVYSVMVCVGVAILCTHYHISSWGIPAGGVHGVLIHNLLTHIVPYAYIPYGASVVTSIFMVALLGEQLRSEMVRSWWELGGWLVSYGVRMRLWCASWQKSPAYVAEPSASGVAVVAQSKPRPSRRGLPQSSAESVSVLAAVWGDRTQPTIRTQREYGDQAQLLEQKLAQFGIRGAVVNIVVGPVVVRYEYQPHSNVPLNKIIAREHDLALALQATSFRIIAPIPGKALVGFEANAVQRETVLFADYYKELQKSSARIPLLLGVTSAGDPLVLDLVALPHVLVAGSTGSGKSVVLHSMIMSIISSRSCDETRLILIDPKRLEFAVYADIPHLLFPIVVDSRESIKVLRWLVQEMERRYQLLAASQATDSAAYRAAGNDLPDIVVIIDEWADLMMTGGKDAEHSLVRLAQMARAAGIHLIVATQRPSVDVITGLIKVNIPTRIACKVTSKVDSRTIIDTGGAEKLLGKGDMLIMIPGSAIIRGHGMYVSSREIQEVACYVRRCRTAVYHEYAGHAHAALDVAAEDADLYQQVLDVIKSVDEVSISFLQRRLRIGYNRSARMIDYLEAHGMILPSDGSKTRKVVNSKDTL